MNGAVRKKKCSECPCWFWPDPRVRRRQKTCSKECAKKRHLRIDGRWRQRNPGYERGRRLGERQPGGAKKKIGVVPRPQPLERVDWGLVQDEMGIKHAEILADLARVQAAYSREIAAQAKDEIWADVLELMGENLGLRQHMSAAPIEAQDEMWGEANEITGENVGLRRGHVQDEMPTYPLEVKGEIGGDGRSEVPRRNCLGGLG